VLTVRIAARTLMFGGVAGKALGVARELVGAALFGTGPIAVAYRLAHVAFLIPLNGFLSDAFGAGFTPAYARSGMQCSDRGRTLFAGTHAAVLGVSLAVGLLLALCAGSWVRALAPGFDADTARLATQMVALLAVAMPFYALTNLYASAGIAAGDARMAAARASSQNVGLLGGTLLAWWTGEPVYIAAGFLTAYVLLAGWGVRAAWLQGLYFWPRRGEWAAAAVAVRGVWQAVRVLMLVPVMMQVHFVVERRVASIVDANAVAALDYARFLTDTAVLLLAMPLGVASLGAMATLSDARCRDIAYRSLRMLLYAGVPLSLALALHGETIVRAVYARGAFGAESVAATTAILRWLATGLWALLIGYAGAKYLSARNRNARLIGIYGAAFGCNVVLNVALHPFIGAAALGVAAAVNGIVFGLLMLHGLGVLARMRTDLLTVGALAAAYVALWALAPASLTANAWLPPLAFAAYWCTAVSLVPSCRQVVYETWVAVRAA
jgi:putative peptidoglycan lipid II flippase